MSSFAMSTFGRTGLALALLAGVGASGLSATSAAADTSLTSTSLSTSLVMDEAGEGSDLRPYASVSTNGSHPIWHVEPGSSQLDRVGGVVRKVNTAQFHRATSTRRYGGPGKALTISYRARATAIRDRVGSSIVEGAKIGLKWPVSSDITGYSKDDPRSVHGTSTQGEAASPGSYALVTGLTERGYMELARNGYGSDGYKFFSNKAVGYAPGTWKDVVVKVEWLDDRSIRVQYWHNADASGTPVYTATDSASPFWDEPAFLWLRTDDADFEYDRISVHEVTPHTTSVPAPEPVAVEPAPAPVVVEPAPAPVVVEPAPAPVVVEPAPAPAPTTSLYVSEGSFKTVKNGWGPVERNMSNGRGLSQDGTPLTIAGQRFAKGLGMHASAEIRVPVAGARYFSAFVGVDDVTSGRGSVVFQVWDGRRKLAETAKLRGGQPAKQLVVDVRGRSEIRLVVTNAGDGAMHDHADWGNAMLSLEDPRGGTQYLRTSTQSARTFGPLHRVHSFRGRRG